MTVTAYSWCVTERKSIDGRSSDLLVHFARREPPTFEAREAAELLGVDPTHAAHLLTRLVNRGWLTRHRKGVYEVAPIWASAGEPYDPNRFAAVGRWVREPYYVAFRSALEIRDLLDYPVRGRLWIAVPRSRHAPTTLRDRVTWVVLREELFAWGLERQWVGTGTVWVSDIERTLLDGLHLPRHIGGVSETAAALVRVWSDLDRDRLVGYVDRMGIDSVRRRLGFLLEALALVGSRQIAQRLHAGTSDRRRSPVVLDPSLPSEGPVDPRWGVRVNLDLDELRSVGQT